jgi:hypothetical protein
MRGTPGSPGGLGGGSTSTWDTISSMVGDGLGGFRGVLLRGFTESDPKIEVTPEFAFK